MLGFREAEAKAETKAKADSKTKRAPTKTKTKKIAQLSTLYSNNQTLNMKP